MPTISGHTPRSGLLECRVNYARAERQLGEFRRWLAARDEFGESEVVAELRDRLDLCLLIQLAVARGSPDRFKFEFTIQGAFRADLVVGCMARAHFVMVEFEGARRNSIFSRGRARLPAWAPELEHAFGQVCDWTWAKNDSQKSDLYRAAFGLEHMSETYLIVCGRSSFLDPVAQSRLHWRSTKTTIASCPILIWTYDHFCSHAESSLDSWREMQAGLGLDDP